MNNRRYRLLEWCNRPPPLPPMWMPLGPEISEIFHRLIWIDDLKIYLLPHSVRYLKYHWWFIYYGQISKTCWAIFWISVSFLFRGPRNLAQTAFSRGYLKASNQLRNVRARIFRPFSWCEWLYLRNGRDWRHEGSRWLTKLWVTFPLRSSIVRSERWRSFKPYCSYAPRSRSTQNAHFSLDSEILNDYYSFISVKIIFRGRECYPLIWTPIHQHDRFPGHSHQAQPQQHISNLVTSSPKEDDLIKPDSMSVRPSVRPFSVRPSVFRPSVHTFFFWSWWNLVCG